MLTTDARARFARAFSLPFAAVLLVTAYLLLRPHNASMAKGLIQGGVVALVLVAVALWSAARGSTTSPAARIMAGVADERDDRVVEKALAFAGLASFLWMAAAAVAIGVGVRTDMTLGLMLWGQVLTLVAAYVWHSRRS